MGGTSPTVKSAGRHADEADISIGDTAVAAGGIAALGAQGGPGVSETSAGALLANLVEEEAPIKLDGVLGEWGARVPANVVVKGSGDRLGVAFAIQYDDAHLFIAGEIADESFYRTDRFGEGEDHASLILAFPEGASFEAYEVGLFAGKPGETAGEVRWAKRGPIAGSKIVEAPLTKGYSFEASIPWSAFPRARTVRVGLRAVVRYYDSDGSASARNIVATGAGDASSAASLPPLLTEPEQSMLEGLLEPKGLSRTAPKFDLYADVAGDAMKERIAVFDRFFTICGPGYRGGKEFFFRDVGDGLLGLQAGNLTGRNKADLVVRRRFQSDGSARDWFEVWSLIGGDEPVTTFAHEIAVARDGKRVENVVHATAHGIEVTLEPASGWDASSYREPVAIDVEPILLPWGTVRSQSFRFDGSRYKKTKEITQAGVAPPTAPANVAERSSLPVEEPPTPRTRAGGDLSSQVFDQYKRDHGVAVDARPKVDLQVNVDGDAPRRARRPRGTRHRRVRPRLLGRDAVRLPHPPAVRRPERRPRARLA